tara:strand:- start:1081 stop:1323 length:243 start_codon:yes stop_codon:yes gene_type:complete
MNNEIKFKYYFKKNHKVYKNELNYLQLLNLLDMQNKTDNKGQAYKKGHTYQLQWLQEFLLNNKDLKIFKCNVYLQDQIIL